MRRFIILGIIVLLLAGVSAGFASGEFFPDPSVCDTYERTVENGVVHETCGISGDSREAVLP